MFSILGLAGIVEVSGNGLWMVLGREGERKGRGEEGGEGRIRTTKPFANPLPSHNLQVFAGASQSTSCEL